MKQFILIMSDTLGSSVVGAYGRLHSADPAVATSKGNVAPPGPVAARYASTAPPASKAETAQSSSNAATGSARGRRSLTPHIDRFASRSVVFEHAYTNCPLCTPARSALHTGIPAFATGSWSLEMPLGRTIRTVAERLSSAGYHCAHIGKWHLSATDYFDTGEAPPGFDARWWFDGRAHLESLPDDVRERTRAYPKPGETPIHRDHTFAGGVTDRARRFLKTHGGEDFFLTVSYDEPHAPCVTPLPFATEYHDVAYPIGPNAHDDLADKPASHRHWRDDPGLAAPASASVRDGRSGEKFYVDQPYFAATAFVDSEIGAVLDVAARLAPEATILITGDHGDMMGGHGLFKKGPALYEETVRVPMILGIAGSARNAGPNDDGPRDAGPPDAGSRDDGPRGAGPQYEAGLVRTPVSLLDVTPTILDHFAVTGPDWLPGESLGSLSSGSDNETGSRPATADAERAVFLEFGRFSPYNDGRGGFRPIRGIVADDHKLVLNLLDSDELYDLGEDPSETRNLIDSPAYTEVRNRLHDRLLDWMGRMRDPFRGPEWRYRSWREKQAYTWPNGGRGRLADTHEKPMLNYSTGRERKE